MNVIQKSVTQLVKAYRNLPFKPFNGALRNAYYKFLKQSIDNRTVMKKVGGINYELDLTEVIDSAIYYNGNREPETTKALGRLCNKGDVVFDIGANIGSITLPIAKYIGESGKIYAFEPVPWALDKLNKNLSLNSFKNIQVIPIALSDYVDDNAEFSLRASFKTAADIPVNHDGELNNHWWHACEKVNVKVETMDSFVVREGITNIDVIKLDVDGFEAKVLRGAKNTLQFIRPIILMELAPAWLKAKGDDIGEVLSILIDNGYTFFDESTFKEIPDISTLVADIKPEGGVNVIASVNSLDVE